MVGTHHDFFTDENPMLINMLDILRFDVSLHDFDQFLGLADRQTQRQGR